MPIIKDSAPVDYPIGNPVLVKYLDLTKFISLLQKEAIFFCRLDKLEDQFEGTTATANYENRLRVERKMRTIMRQTPGFLAEDETDPDNADSIRHKVNEYYDFENKLKALNCVNCWNYEDRESVALWKIYSDFGKGIMIKSTLSKIEAALSKTKEEIRVSNISYIDYASDLMPDYNSIYPIIHKDIAYSYEKEVRFIYEIIPPNGWTHEWAKEEVDTGKYIQIEKNILIEEVIVAPYAPKWYYDMITDLCSKYNLGSPIRKSRLSISR